MEHKICGKNIEFKNYEILNIKNMKSKKQCIKIHKI